MYQLLEDLREDFDLTQKDVADHLNLTHSAYVKIERGDWQLFVEVLIKLSNLYIVSTDYLLGLTNYPKRIKDIK